MVLQEYNFGIGQSKYLVEPFLVVKINSEKIILMVLV